MMNRKQDYQYQPYSENALRVLGDRLEKVHGRVDMLFRTPEESARQAPLRLLKKQEAKS